MDDILSWYYLIAIVTSYLLGSIPTSVWVGKRFFNTDVREKGSRNAGATNTFRVLGKKAGIPVLLFDIFKGWLPVFIFSQFNIASTLSGNSLINFQLILGASAVIGHVFSIFLKFKGGKGIATLLGLLLALQPLAALLCMMVFMAVFLTSRYVSLSSMVAAILFPVFIKFIFVESPTSLIYFSIAVGLLVLLTHRKNISRLLNNSENKISFNKKHDN